MKRFFKLLSLSVLSLVLVVGATIGLAGCGKKDKKETQVVSLSVNPGVEFVVDSEDKVVSVTANNEDGAYILNKFTEFTGMSAKDAALKFLELSEQYGFVVEGSTDGETFTISVSGEGAEDLYNDIKGKINSKVTELGLAVGEMVEITKTELETMVAECYQEYSKTEVQNLTEEELVNLLKQSRIETKDLHTEDERFAYYRDRALEMVEAKIEAVNSYINTNASVIEKTFVTPFLSILVEIPDFIEEEYNTVKAMLEEEFTAVETELDSYITKKEAYLAKVQEYRNALENNADADPSNDVLNVEELKQQYETLKEQAKTIYLGLEEERQSIKAEILTFMQTTFQAQLEILNAQINSIVEYVEINMQEIQTTINTKLTELKNSYVANSENPWEE